MSVVGLTEAIHFENLKIYPNPVTDKLQIEFTDAESQDLKLELFNSLGKIVYTTAHIEEKQEIDLSEFPGGMYFLKIQNAQMRKVYKIVKQ